jgi:hypothetical protein
VYENERKKRKRKEEWQERYERDESSEKRKIKVQGRMLMTMCGSRTGGWSLPGVMSD